MTPVVAVGELLRLGDQLFLDLDCFGSGCGTLLGDLALAIGGASVIVTRRASSAARSPTTAAV